jgi:ornithine cyclodeaminase/alanine dehydrogenase-like protein (mu-crystallin family)
MALLINNDVSRRMMDMEEAVEVMEDAWVQLANGDAAFMPRTDMGSSKTVDLGPEYDYSEYWLAVLQGLISDPPRYAMRFRSDLLGYVVREGGGIVGERYNVEPGKFLGFILLFDASTGELIGLMNDGIIQHVRVAAQAAVGAKYLAREDATEIGMIGSGGMAESYVEALSTVRDIQSVKVYSPTTEHREQFATKMSDRLGIEVTPKPSPQEAVEGTDIVATCTSSATPVYDHEWLEPGQFLVDVRPSEIDSATVEAIDRTIVTDRRPHIAWRDIFVGPDEDYEKRLELMGGSDEGINDHKERDYPTLSQLISGETPGRESADETVFFYNRSAGIQFAALGNMIYEKAKENDLGTAIPLEWFHQDIKA